MVRVLLRSRHFLSQKLWHFHKNIISCVENECCCPRTINISHVNITSKICHGTIVINHIIQEYLMHHLVHIISKAFGADSYASRDQSLNLLLNTVPNYSIFYKFTCQAPVPDLVIKGWGGGGVGVVGGWGWVGRGWLGVRGGGGLGVWWWGGGGALRGGQVWPRDITFSWGFRSDRVVLSCLFLTCKHRSTARQPADGLVDSAVTDVYIHWLQ